ncbi:MAG TPA: hypothetical protein PLJ11_04040 [Methanomassiliicoccales archaeon]|jgi:hypothetical protein|nr:hypothetical protein [Methanomassiliicoccales archaeon]HRR67188.1 hypothetical protein [Methanomassiliicoccales archaeon]HRU11331.1 hypothetical protein [Methanomassiliicoccales archaeon]
MSLERMAEQQAEGGGAMYRFKNGIFKDNKLTIKEKGFIAIA